MHLDLAFSSIFLESDLRRERLLRRMRGGLPVRVESLSVWQGLFLFVATFDLLRHKGLGLTNGIITLNDLLCRVEYCIEVGQRQKRLGVTCREPVFAQPLLYLSRQP